jgi:threonine aldolase
MTFETFVDLRSDTVTQPTSPMREAMFKAKLGDDVFGDDPTVNALQEKTAQLLGFDAALFMASGTQSNLCALLAHCERGDEYVVGQLAHTYRHEGGGGAVLGGIQPQPLPQTSNGELALVDIASAIKPDDIHFARTKLLCLENTWMGFPLSKNYLLQATDLAKKNGLAVHLDGARLFNAAVADASKEGEQNPFASARRITACFESVSLCFSKGLGTPIGSILCGSNAFVRKALKWRKMVGGGMRQVGMLAAAADYALDHHIQRLEVDHALAQRLAQGLNNVTGLRVRSVQTNIVFVDVADGRGGELLTYLKKKGVLATGLVGLRFVTHLDVDSAGIDYALACIKKFFIDYPVASGTPVSAVKSVY